MITIFDSAVWMVLAEGAAAPPPGSIVEQVFRGPWVPLVMVMVLFYFLFIRPDRKRRAEMERLRGNLKKNDRVITIGGIYGTVVNVHEGLDEVTIKVDENTSAKLRIRRNAVDRVLSPDGKSEIKKD